MKARFLALLALVLGLVSCQQDNVGLDVDLNGEAAVTVSVAIPDMDTRAGGNDSAKGAFGNVDLTKYDVRYILEVYNVDGSLAKERFVNYEDNAMTTAFNLRLIPGRGYRFVVWADFVKQVDVERDPASNYDLHYNTTDLKNIQLATAEWNLADESRDAYTGYEDVAEFKSTSNITVELKRPFGKLRVVTTDIKDMFNVLPEDITVEYTSDIYTSFDAYASDVKSAEKVTDVKTIKISENKYTNEWNAEGKVKENLTLFADYFFAAKDAEPIQFTLDVKDNKGGVIPQVVFNTAIPIQRNYLTTVMGPVLTDSSNIKVTVEDAFENGTNWNPEDDKYDVEIWDGKSISAPAYDEATKTYTIELPSELAWLAAAVSGTLEDTRATVAPQTFQGKTFKLAQDIDLGGEEWTPIGNSTNKFQGTFDGQDHKIANLLITGNKSDVGLFGFTTNGEIKNLVVENAKVSGYLNVAVVAGTPYTSKYNNITVQGHVEINGFSYVGAVGGKNAYANWTNITVNVDETSYVNANSVEDGVACRTYVGGVCGFNGEGGHSFKNITSNIDVKGSTIDVGGLFGIAHYGNQFENCSCSGDVEIYAAEEDEEAQEIGGIAGVWNNGGADVVFANCTFTGTLKTNIAVDFYYGGLVGKPYSATGTGVLVLNGTRYQSEESKNVSAEDGEFYATIDEALKANNNEVALGDGEFALPSTLATDTTDGNTVVTISGNGIDKSTLRGSNNANGNANNPGNYADGLDLVFENLTYVTVNNGYQGGFGHAKSVTFRNCKIVGQFYCHSNAPHFFYDCTIDPLTGYLYTYASDCIFEHCHFAASEGKALQIYEDAASGENTVTINDCTFKADKQATTYDGKPVTGIDINSNGAKFTVYVNNCTTEGFPVGLNSGSTLWNVKDSGKAHANLYIDGEPAWLAEYTLVDNAKYPSLFAKGGDYYVFGVEGLASLNQYFKDNWCGNNTWTPKYNIAADIDAEGFTWDGVWVNVGNNYNNGLVINGNNHTISNLTINNFFLSGTPNGGDDTATPGEVKNITIDNATVVGGSHDAAIFWGSCYGDVNFENVTVKNSKISGGSNVGAFVSRTTIENAETVVNLKFTNCKVENCELSADNLSADPTGASGFIGRAYGNTTLSFKGTNSVDAATVINNAEGLVGGRVYGYGVWANGGWTGLGACDSFVAFNGVKFVETNDIKEIETVSPGENTTLADDVNGSAKETTANSGYGAAGIVVDGGVFDGNGKTFTVSDANSTWDCAIAAKGGTIKNLTVAGAMRGIFMPGANDDLYIDNVIFEDVVYTFNSDAGNKNFGVYISNSTLNGWTSFSAVHKEVVFTNCKFGEGSGYAFCRPYNDTVFENCDFENGFSMDARGVVTFKNCTYNGVHLNKDNYTNLVTSNAQNVRFE